MKRQGENCRPAKLGQAHPTAVRIMSRLPPIGIPVAGAIRTCVASRHPDDLELTALTFQEAAQLAN